MQNIDSITDSAFIICFRVFQYILNQLNWHRLLKSRFVFKRFVTK
jgi:hypothetical protein